MGVADLQLQLSSHFPIPTWPAHTTVPVSDHTRVTPLLSTLTKTHIQGFHKYTKQCFQSQFLQSYLFSKMFPGTPVSLLFPRLLWLTASSFPPIRDGFKVPFKPNPLYVFSATLAKYTDEVFYQRSQWSHSNPKTSSPCHNDWFERLNKQTLLSSGQFQKFKMCLEGMAHTLNSCMCCVRHDSHTQSL